MNAFFADEHTHRRYTIQKKSMEELRKRLPGLRLTNPNTKNQKIQFV